MSSLAGFLLRIVKATASPEKETRRMSIIIQRPYAYLKEELRRAFKGQKDVKIIVDRRYGERRTSQQPVELSAAVLIGEGQRSSSSKS